MKVSPFFLHLFFAIGVVQGIEIQFVAVKVKVNAGFAFTLNRLIYSLLWGEVKGEGKNGKFAESASAYMRVGAFPARRIEWEFVWGREVLRETREEVAKSGDVLRESRLVFFEWSGGGREKPPSFLFFLACQSRNSGELQTKAPPSNLFFRLKMRFWARKSYVSKKKTPRKVWFSTQKRPNREKYRSFGANMIGRGWSEKTGFTAVFATL